MAALGLRSSGRSMFDRSDAGDGVETRAQHYRQHKSGPRDTTKLDRYQERRTLFDLHLN
jgi:hypothetical protein